MEANVQPTELGNLGIGSRPLFSALMLRTMVSHTVMGSHTHSPPWNNSPIQMSQDLSYIFTKQAQQPKMLVGLLFLWSKHCPGTQGMQNITFSDSFSMSYFQGKSTHFFQARERMQGNGEDGQVSPETSFTCIPVSLWASLVCLTQLRENILHCALQREGTRHLPRGW